MTTAKKPRRMAREPEQSGTEPSGREAGAPPVDQEEIAPPQPSKKSIVIAMLGKESGASLAAIVAATSWLPHTTRAALTGLRKQGHQVERFKLDGETRYRIIAGVTAECSND